VALHQKLDSGMDGGEPDHAGRHGLAGGVGEVGQQQNATAPLSFVRFHADDSAPFRVIAQEDIYLCAKR
jgi:hypothetical protein